MISVLHEKYMLEAIRLTDILQVAIWLTFVNSIAQLKPKMLSVKNLHILQNIYFAFITTMK